MRVLFSSLTLRTRLRAWLGVVFVLVASAHTAAEVYVPDALEPWEQWVLDDLKNIDCPISNKNGKRTSCVWLSRLSLNVSSATKRADFRIDGRAYANSNLKLPSSSNRPVDVTINGETARVGELNGKSRIYLNSGEFRIEGRLHFDLMPRTIDVPQIAAIITLTVDGVPIATPKLEDGKLWLQSQHQSTDAKETLGIEVFRKLSDDIPQVLDTRLRLTVDGRDRVESLGYPIFEGFVANHVDSKLPVQVTRDGEFKVQVTRGVHWLTVVSTSEKIIDEFKLSLVSPAWPAEEIWAFDEVPAHRSVDIEGVRPIDPNLAESPFGSMPTFRAAMDATLVLTDEKRGDPNRKPATFEIDRELWLSFDGQSMVTSDFLSVDAPEETRISASYQLGTVFVDGDRRLITHLETDTESNPGVLIHPSSETVSAMGIVGQRSGFSANGWGVNADSLTLKLNVPPGWKLLWTTGVDQVRGAWLAGWWNLGEIFLAVLIIVVLFRVGGFPIAVIAAIAVVLSYQDHQVPANGWLLLGLLLLLERVLKSERLRNANAIVYWLLFVPVAVASIYVAANNVRQAIYPQLDSILGQAMSSTSISHERVPATRQTLARSEALDLREHIVSGNFKQREEQQYLDRPAVDSTDEADPDRGEPYVPLAVQTGPGKPTWQWDSAYLHWSGPVAANQTIGLTFSPPPLTRVLWILIALLHLFMLFVFVFIRVRNFPGLPPWVKKIVPVFLISAAASTAQGNFPDQAILDDLKERLTTPPSCIPGCVSIEEASFEMSDETNLVLSLRYLTEADVAVDLPVSEPQTAVTEVTRNGQRVAVLGSRNNKLQVHLVEGANLVQLGYNLAGIDDLVVNLPRTAAKVSEDLCCAQLSRSLDTQTQRFVVRRFVKTEEAEKLESSTYEFERPVTVSRQILLEQTPRVLTRVRTSSELMSELSVHIPLLEGETVVSDNVTVIDGHAVVVLDQERKSVSWQSSLQLQDSLKLEASDSSSIAEIWFVRGSDFWHVESEGLTPSQSKQDATLFRPRQGESVSLALIQPNPSPGQTFTVKHVVQSTSVGARGAISTITMAIDASVAGKLTIVLPKDAIVEAVLIDNVERTLDIGTNVELSVLNGEHLYVVRWRSNDAIEPFFNTPTISLSEPSRNISQILDLPRNRWVLMLGGPPIGSAVLFWGVVLVTLFVALALTYLPQFPLTKLDAALLAVGATLANIWSLLFVALWIIGIWWRSKNTVTSLGSIWHGIVNVALVFLSVLGLLALFYTVVSALQTPPDMFITGSSIEQGNLLLTSGAGPILRWFSDVSAGALPAAWVFSLPFWVYQLAMLAWSLWLVFALTRWVRFTFTTMSAQPFWPKRARKSSATLAKNAQNSPTTGDPETSDAKTREE